MEVKNAIVGFVSKLDMTKERINELEDSQQKLTKFKRKEKNEKQNGTIFKNRRDHYKRYNAQVTGKSEVKEKNRRNI